MSAFMVSHDHIDAMLTFADLHRLKDRLEYGATGSTTRHLTLTEIGRILLAENERSICARYPDCVGNPDRMPGKIGETPAAYVFRRFDLPITPAKQCAWIIKACHCFDYQACETDHYEQSRAHAVIRAIESAAISALPHYEDAPWGIDRTHGPALRRADVVL